VQSTSFLGDLGACLPHPHKILKKMNLIISLDFTYVAIELKFYWSIDDKLKFLKGRGRRERAQAPLEPLSLLP